jgi:LPXTG-motif cell wall-anchored protein
VNASGAPTPGPGVLPATGSDAGVLWWVLVLVVLGVGLVAAGRRRPVNRTSN